MFPLFALTGARFLQAVFPALPLLPTALVLLLLFYCTNLFGVKLAMWVQAAMVGVLFVALVVFIGAGLPRVDAASFRPLFTGGVGGFAVASALLTFTVLGANAAVELGDEIVDPSRNHPEVVPRVDPRGDGHLRGDRRGGRRGRGRGTARPTGR